MSAMPEAIQKERPTNWVRFLSLPFAALLTWGALQKLMEVNLARSIEHWGSFLAGILLLVVPFIANHFLTSILLGTGIFAITELIHPNPQGWWTLALFVMLTVLIFQPYPKWLRIIFQLLTLGVIGACLWYVWQDFYSGLDHFIQSGKLTQEYLEQRIRTYIPQDFSYYMAVVFLVLSVRQCRRKHSEQ